MDLLERVKTSVMKHHLGFFCIGVVGLFLIVGMIWFFSSDPILYKEYKDGSGRFQFEYPELWLQFNDQDIKNRNLKDLAVGFKKGASEATTAMAVLLKEGKTEVDLEELEQDLDTAISGELPQFEKIDSRMVKVGKYPALLYHYRFLQAGKNVVRQKQMIVFTDSSAYWFIATAQEDDFKTYNQIFNRFFRSIEVYK